MSLDGLRQQDVQNHMVLGFGRQDSVFRHGWRIIQQSHRHVLQPQHSKKRAVAKIKGPDGCEAVCLVQNAAEGGLTVFQQVQRTKPNQYHVPLAI